MQASNTNREPILVTGAHRTGTTWVGKMLVAGGEAAYISEPLNVWHRPGVMSAPVKRWYTYINSSNEAEYLPAFQSTLHYRYQWTQEIRSLRSLKDFMRMGRDLGIFISGKAGRKRPLLKDPFAVFSAPWFKERLGCRVVITVRHPAAFASSLKRLNWAFDFTDLLDQGQLMEDWLEPYREAMEASRSKPGDVIEQASLLWRMIYQTVRSFQEQFPEFQVVRHEDFSERPLEGFETLYRDLGLNFTDHAARVIKKSSSAENPKELSKSAVHSVQLNSQANIDNWKRRLDQAEIARIRELTEEISSIYYPESTWGSS